MKRGISAGRVQSVALRLIVEREEERLAFVPEEFWNFKAQLAAGGMPFKAELAKINGKKAQIKNEEQALAVEKALKSASFVVESVEEKERSKSPAGAFYHFHPAAGSQPAFGLFRQKDHVRRPASL